MFMNCRGLIVSLAILFYGIGVDALAQERLCPDGKRSYFGVCPDAGNQSRPLPTPEPIPVTPPAHATPQVPVPPTLTPSQQTQNKPASVWINQPLYGHDNRVAAFRKVLISQDGPGKWSVFISNQMGFRCTIEFDSNGDPATLRYCKPSAQNSEWVANPSVISMVCISRAKERVCSGKYNLGTLNDPMVWGADEFIIARKM